MSESTTERARGRWKDILLAVGIPAKLVNGKNQPCPFCGGKDRFRFTNHEERGCYICSKCGGGSGFDLIMKIKGLDFKTAVTEVEGVIGHCRKTPARNESDKRKAMNDLWRSAKRIGLQDPVGRYLNIRCGLSEFPSSLRHAPSLRYFGSPDSYPAMLAKLTGPDGVPCNIHRTYLMEDGRKAPVDAPRRMMPGSISKGSAVRLADAGLVLGIAEGIETALSASQLFGVPTWAALNAELMRSWLPPIGVEKVVIFGDNDANFTGQAAAYDLAKRLAASGICSEIKIPEQIGHDWNDVWCSQRERAAA